MSEWKPARIELSAGGVIFRNAGGSEILLIKDSYGNWGFPKGHVEAGESGEEAAVRECREETGLSRLRVLGVVGATDWYFRIGETLVHKFCDYFLMEADPREEVEPEQGEGVQACVWLDPEAAAERVTYGNARQLLQEALHRIGPLRGAQDSDSNLAVGDQAGEP